MGTIVNALAVLIGSCIGLLLKKGISKNYEQALFKALGIAVLIVGLNGVITSMISISGENLVSSGELMLIISLVLGTVIGEKLKIEQRLNNISSAVEKRFKLSGFARGFVNASLLYCVGAMTIVGSINDGLFANPSVLYTKSMLDGIASVVLSATLGPGVAFAALPVLLYQGSISLAAGALNSILQGQLLSEISMVGYSLVICTGYNFLSENKIKTANLLPALLISPIWHFILFLFA